MLFRFFLASTAALLFCAAPLWAADIAPAPVAPPAPTPAQSDALSEPTPGELAEEARMAVEAGSRKNMHDAYYLKVGESKPIYAQRPDKCDDPNIPPFTLVQKKLPSAALIKFTDGGATQRFSKRCDRIVPALMILATGVKAGKETITLDGRKINLVVE